MEEWPAARVRQRFLDFFTDRDHAPWPSSPVVPVDDPELLFANAGMNQFKPVFLGAAGPNSPLGCLRRACNTQKCIRAGGKHNDLDQVGKDTYHHTFFEMLGTWSFGDYFKEEAIGHAWELLTKVYKLPAERFYATYFGGDEKAGISSDTESRDIWLHYLPKERVLAFGCKDNFWEMGETGPCGPCTEIHFDCIGNRDATLLLNNDDPTCIEIWNLVFIQFNRESDGTLRSLPTKHVDTGMGFERLTSILQNKTSNYDSDLFMPLFGAIHKWVGVGIEPYSGKVGFSDVGKVDTAYRVVADHIRTLSFAIADGSQPGNEGREYVLRRILGQAVYFGRQKLMAKQGFLSALVDVFVRVMGNTFPELKDNEKKIKDIIKDEEASFEKGFERFKKAADAARENGGAVFSGQDAFFLWDTYGYPIDLTEVMAVDLGLSVDMEGFNICMQNPRQKASNARDKGGGKSFVLDANATSQLHNQGLASSDASPKFPHKVYTNEDLESILWSSVFNLDHIQPLDIHNVNPYKLKDFQEIMSYAKNDVAYFSFHQKVQRTTRAFGKRGERWRCTSNPYSKPAGKLCQIKKFTCYKKSDGCDQKEKGRMDEFVLKVGNKEDSEIKVLCRVYEEKRSETEEEKKKEEKEKAKQQKEEKANNKEPKCISKELQELSLVNKKTSLEEATSVEALLKEKEHLISEIQQMKVHLTSKISCLEKELQIARENLKVADVAATEAKARCDKKNKRIQDLENRLVDAELRNVEGDKLRKKQLEQILELKGNLRVFVRVKPFLMKNDSNGVENEKLISYPTSKESPDCTIVFNGKVYTYDKVFGPEASQRDVFVEMTELLQSVMDGKNVCIFTYGQTGSGKTYTMIGESGDKVGIFPRSLEQIFTAKQSKENEAWNISIKLSIVEIYNNKLKDFMGASENSDGSYLKKEVSSFDEVAHYLQLATDNRSTATTLMNEASSRSHLAFSLYISQSNEYTDRPVESTIIFIDLAGSENATKSGVEGDQLKETQAINTSLSALTDMLLAMARSQTHIPYRHSTLTKFLMQYLGETSKKLMFVNVSPEPSNMSETANSLWFASMVNRTDVSVLGGKPNGKNTTLSSPAPSWKPRGKKTLLSPRTVVGKPRGKNPMLSPPAPGGKYRVPRAPILSPSQSRPLTVMWK